MIRIQIQCTWIHNTVFFFVNFMLAHTDRFWVAIHNIWIIFFREYIRQKNAAADQCSGSSSGYYSSYRGESADQPPPPPPQDLHRRQQSLSSNNTKDDMSMMMRRGGGQEEAVREEFRPIDCGGNGRYGGGISNGHRMGNFTPSSHSSYHSNGY